MDHKPLIFQKREDLQGIRGIAIIAVVAFHFFPNFTPNGFLGVDQFFVLSGYLMCMLLRKGDQKNPCSLVTNFYSKRMKRILPLYLFVIMFALISLYALFPETSWMTNQKSASQALIFMSNRAETLEEDYFKMLSIAIDIFTHTWSLSVEVQFYFIIPFFYLVSRKLSVRCQCFYYIGIGFLAYLLSTSSSSTDSNSLNEAPEQEETQKLLSETEDSDDTPNSQRNQKLEKITKPTITITTGILILFSKSEQVILSNKVFTYTGDISYALYLIHWPIYAYWKLTMKGDKTALLLCLLGSILFSIVIHETYEKWYLKQCSTTIGLLTIILLFVNVALINKDKIIDNLNKKPVFHNSSKALTLADAARLNHIWNVMDYVNLNVPACIYESACEPLYPTRQSETCKSNFTDFEEHIRMEKPDYVFMLTRFVTIGDPISPGTNDDSIYQIMKGQMLKLIPNIAQKLYILDAMPRPNIDYIEKIVPMIKNGVPLKQIDNLLVNTTLYETARDRYSQLGKDCGEKCVLVDYNPEFWNSTTGTFRFFDEIGRSYFTTTTHLTPRGLEKIRHVWRDICSRIL